MRVLIAAAILALGSTPASAQKWQVLEEESVSLSYVNAQGETVLAISCHPNGSDIVVPVSPGVKKPDGSVGLTLQTAGGSERLAMEVEVCGGDMQCTDRPDGDVSTYRIYEKGKRLPLKAITARQFVIDAPGAKLSIASSAQPFQQFERLCRRWK